LSSLSSGAEAPSPSLASSAWPRAPASAALPGRPSPRASPFPQKFYNRQVFEQSSWVIVAYDLGGMGTRKKFLKPSWGRAFTSLSLKLALFYVDTNTRTRVVLS